jgi:hypothetical protein
MIMTMTLMSTKYTHIVCILRDRISDLKYIVTTLNSNTVSFI